MDFSMGRQLSTNLPVENSSVRLLVPRPTRTDRKAIIYRNAARRDAKKLENKEQKDPLLGHSKHLEPKLTSVVQNVMTLHQTDKHHADYEPLDMYYTADLEHPLSQHLEEPHDSVVHHYSRSPKLLRAKLSAEVHENDWAADDLTDTRISSGGNFSHLSAYPRGSKPPLANYDNL
ncbi:unnamed protein product [Echinostoma caproni]|uniref:Uncharacterized protein n=1 Tax=Echinostoma caproni TaxID=27848 RepID=A0A183A7Q7_9TREM|nr:unnamed protein product [Echinostoma caproni]